MENFIKKLQEQLDNMTEEAKDQWILTQARLLPEHKQEDFYQSICGKKVVMNMPGLDEIAAFCDRVERGEIVMQYETHYIEFDDFISNLMTLEIITMSGNMISMTLITR